MGNKTYLRIGHLELKNFEVVEGLRQVGVDTVCNDYGLYIVGTTQ